MGPTLCPQYPRVTLPIKVEDSFSEDEDITWAVKHLHHTQSGGLYSVWAENLQYWLAVSTREDYQYNTHWQKVVLIIQA